MEYINITADTLKKKYGDRKGVVVRVKELKQLSECIRGIEATMLNDGLNSSNFLKPYVVVSTKHGVRINDIVFIELKRAKRTEDTDAKLNAWSNKMNCVTSLENYIKSIRQTISV